MVTPNLADSQAVLEQVVTAWNHSASSWDAKGIAATYCKDAMLFGGRAGHFVGRAAIRDYFASYNGIIVSATMQLSEMLDRELGSGYRLFQGMAHFEFRMAHNKKTQSKLRATLVLIREADGWYIIDHHFSTIPIEPPLNDD